MTYAGTRRIVDADSHVMERADFLVEHADPAMRDRIPRLDGGRTGLDMTSGAHTDEERAALVGLGDGLIKRGPKWHAALGAVVPAERSTALDLLGFERQVIFSSLCALLFDIRDDARRYASYRAHNRAVASFCAGDERLLGVALTDLDDVDASLAELEAAHALGLRLAWLPARAPNGERSPGHPDHDRVWAWLAEHRMPFVLHVGSGALPI